MNFNDNFWLKTVKSPSTKCSIIISGTNSRYVRLIVLIEQTAKSMMFITNYSRSGTTTKAGYTHLNIVNNEKSTSTILFCSKINIFVHVERNQFEE